MGATQPGAALLQRHDFKNRQRETFVENGTLTYDVLRGGYIEKIVMMLRGSLTVAGGTVNGTSLGENPGNLLQRFFVDAAPIGQIKSLSPRSLIRNTIFDYGRLISDTALTGAAGTFTILQPFFLHFALPTLISPIEAALESAAFTSIQVRALLGGRDTQFAGNDRTFTYTSLNLDLLDQREVMSGRTAVVFEDDIFRLISSANTRFSISDFPLGQRYLDQLYVFETTNQALSDAIMNRLTVQSGGAVFADAFEDDFRMESFRSLKDAATALTGVHKWWASPLTGGKQILRGAVDARSLSQMSAVLDVSNPGTDRVIVNSRRILLAEDLGS